MFSFTLNSSLKNTQATSATFPLPTTQMGPETGGGDRVGGDWVDRGGQRLGRGAYGMETLEVEAGGTAEGGA